MTHYHAIIIGTGQAGPSLATSLASEGQQVAIIEGAQVGGSCVNYGCTPTKTLRASARVLHQARRAGEYGIQIGPITVDFPQVMARKDQIVGNSSQSLRSWMEGTENLTLYQGWARFDGRDGQRFRVVIDDDTLLTADRVFLNTGTHAAVPPIPGLADVPYLTNIELMNLTALPEHLIILGGGYIGLEMGQIMRRFGAEVTIIEGGPHVAGREDDDVIAAIEDLLTGEGITLLTSHRAQSAAQATDRGIVLTVTDKDGNPRDIHGSHLLVATGRRPNSANLNLASVGVETDERGFVPVNGRLETSVPGIWALGDLNGRGAFTHTSYQDFEIVHANLQGGQRSADDRIMAYAVYLDPPLGRVGMSEKDVRASGQKALMSLWQMANVSRAKEESETHGLIKILVSAETEQILGATVFGFQGDDIIQVISNFMYTGASYQVMRDALPIHPTVTEFMPTILKALQPLD